MATNLFRKTQSLYASTANTFSTGDSETITPASVAGLPTDTEMTLTFDRVDSGGTETPTKMERIIGVVTGGNFVSRVTTGRGADGSTEQAHTSPVVEYIPNAKDMDDAVDGILVEHLQTGKHGNITASTVNIGTTVALLGTLDEDTMSANSASHVVTQQSIKAYSDSGTQTLTNKTLTSPTIDAATLTGTQAYGDNAPNIAPKCRVYLSATQENIANDTWTKVLFDTESYDIGSDYDVANKRFVAPVTGYYLVNVNIGYFVTGMVADKKYYAGIYVNGALYSANISQASIVSDHTASVSDIVYVEAGQYIEGYTRHVAGATTPDISASEQYCYMSIHLLST